LPFFFLSAYFPSFFSFFKFTSGTSFFSSSFGFPSPPTFGTGCSGTTSY
jgi:hypothetical protein